MHPRSIYRIEVFNNIKILIYSCFSLNIYRSAFQRFNMVLGQIEANLLPFPRWPKALQCLQRHPESMETFLDVWLESLKCFSWLFLNMALTSVLSPLYFSGAFVHGTSEVFGLHQIYILIFDEDLHFGID